MVVRSDAPWKTFQEFLAYAKANPGKINYGTSGAGTSLHLTMEQIAGARGIRRTHVPFKGTAETTQRAARRPYRRRCRRHRLGALVNSGQFRLLVTWNAARSKNWPDVPTLREAGVDLVSNSPFGTAGPKGMDPKIVQILHDAFKKGAEDPAYIESSWPSSTRIGLYEQRTISQVRARSVGRTEETDRGPWPQARPT